MKNIKDKIIGIIIGLLMASGLVYAAVNQEVLINVQGSGDILNPIRVRDISDPSLSSFQSGAGVTGIVGYSSNTTKQMAGVSEYNLNVLPYAVSNSNNRSFKLSATTVSASAASLLTATYIDMEAPETNTDAICIYVDLSSFTITCPPTSNNTLNGSQAILLYPGKLKRFSISAFGVNGGSSVVTYISNSGTQDLLLTTYN